VADESSRVVLEAAATLRFVQKFFVYDETHFDSFHPAVVLAYVLEPVIQFRKLTVVKVSRRDDDAIDVAASLIEGLVSQRAPQANANEIPLGVWRKKSVVIC